MMRGMLQPFGQRKKPITPSGAFVQEEMGASDVAPMAGSQYVTSSPASGGILDLVTRDGSGDDAETIASKREQANAIDTAKATADAADDSSSSPMAARRYIDGYMNDPEWKKAHQDEDDVVEKLAPGIGTMILDRLTRGAYSQGRVRQLEAARLQKRDVEKRYLDIQSREDFLDQKRRDEDKAWDDRTTGNLLLGEKLDDGAAARRVRESTAAAQIAAHDAQIEQSNAHTRYLNIQADTLGATGKIINVPANTDAYSVTDQGARRIASGPDKQWNPSGSRDYGAPTGTAILAEIGDLSLQMRKEREAAQAMNPGSREATITDAEIEEAATRQVRARYGASAPSGPSAAPRYVQQPGQNMWGIGSPAPQAGGMPGQAEPKRIRINMQNGNRRP